MRFDVALFELRLAKSRTQAADTIRDGDVLLNGATAKPSTDLRPGDRVTLIGPLASRTVEVLELPRGSLSREKARALLRDVGPGEATSVRGPGAPGR
jgi:ribosome-associated heat shock protein Hsp15